MLEGLPGVLTIHDDILLYGEGDTYEEASRDHDAKLHKLMMRCREQNVKLNKDKMKLRLDQVPYIGQLLTSQGLKPDPEKVGNCEEDLPKKPVGRLLADSRRTDGQQILPEI